MKTSALNIEESSIIVVNHKTKSELDLFLCMHLHIFIILKCFTNQYTSKENKLNYNHIVSIIQSNLFSVVLMLEFLNIPPKISLIFPRHSYRNVWKILY